LTWPLHVANCIFLISYAVKEIFWLRFVTVFAGLITVGALLDMPTTPRDLLAWQLVFFAINFVRFVQLVYERRPVRLSPDAKKLAASTFRELRPRELLRLLAVGETIEHAAGARVVEQGRPLDHLAIVVDGTARVELSDRRTVELGHGKFIGELSYLTGKPPAASVLAATSLRTVRWPTDALRAFLAKHPDTRTAIQLVLGSDLAAKLRSA
jgi:Cyclic nucleotide-binding domain